MSLFSKIFGNKQKDRQFHDDAAEGRHEKVLEHIKRGIDVNSRNPSGGTALMIAAKRGHLRVIQSLLQSGADPNIALNGPDQTYRALHSAAQEGYDQIVGALLDQGAAINAATGHGETALISAAFYGRTSTVQLLLSRGADPDRTAMGKRASDWARENGHTTTAQVLEAAQGCKKL